MRLIDATAYRKELESEKASQANSNDVLMGLEIAIADLGDMPTIDAVPVVWCKNCIHQTHDGNDTPYCLSLEMYLNKELDFFCSYGERKEGAD